MNQRKAFTLIELLIAMSISAIILAAVATMAYAMSSANDVAEQTSRDQAYLRFATMRVSELIRNSKLICKSEQDYLAIWRADDNKDGQINLDELTYIGRCPNTDCLHIFEFYGDNRVLNIPEIKPLNQWQNYGCSTYRMIKVIPNCYNIRITVDAAPPQTRIVSISFNLPKSGNMDGEMDYYQINASLRAWSGHLLDDYGLVIRQDDDDYFVTGSSPAGPNDP